MTTGIVKGTGVDLEDRDVDRQDDGFVTVGKFKSLDVDAAGVSADSGNGSDELVGVVSLLEDATGGSSCGGHGTSNSVGLIRGVAWMLVISFALSQ